MKKNSERKIELLAPAGGIKQFIAAVENGADAVYIGGSQYNARIGAGNFSVEEIKQAVNYGHLRGVKTYVTMNTLIYDSELEDAVRYAKKLYCCGVDALIIQDLGLGLAIKTAMPDFELHLSTQATVYNKEGVLAAKELGYSRVVLARETSIEQIRECSGAPNTDLEEGYPEIEVFVHGALCMCYSGQCQLSRYIGLLGGNGTRSGNRGMCAQPCRLPYVYRSTNGEMVGQEYPLSPKDLCMIDKLGELIEAGAVSLKIEGRMKSPEYVAVVTRIYRKYLDQYMENGQYSVSFEDRMELEQIFNRGGFTEGYAVNNPGDEILSGVMPKNQGIPVGECVGNRNNGLYAEIRLYPEIKLTDEVNRLKDEKCQRINNSNDENTRRKDSIRHETDRKTKIKMQDVIEIHNAGESFSTKVTYLKENGGTIIVGDMKEKVHAGDKVYRIVSDELNEKARATFEHKEFSHGKNIRRLDAEISFTAFVGQQMKAAAKVRLFGKNISAEADSGDFVVGFAESRETLEEEIKEKLLKSGDTTFKISKVRIKKDDGIFVPVGKVSELRREVLEKLSQQILASFDRKIAETTEKLNSGTRENALSEVSDLANTENPLVRLADFIENDRNGRFNRYNDYEDIPFELAVLPQVTKGKYDEFVSRIGYKLSSHAKSMQTLPDDSDSTKREKADRLPAAVCNNIGQVYAISKTGARVVGGRGLNITNKLSSIAYSMIGMSDGYLTSAELLDAGEMDGVPLMVTEHRMIPGTLTDRRGQQYAVEYDETTEKSYIFAIAK